MENAIYKQLIQSLNLAASPASIQISSLPNFVHVPEEVALIYNDSYLMIPQLSDTLSESVIKMLNELDLLFEKMSNNKSLWTIECLKHDIDWENIRRLSMLILVELGESYTEPNIEGFSWING